MEQRRSPEYILEVLADPTSVKDVVKGMYSALIRSCGSRGSCGSPDLAWAACLTAAFAM